MTLLARIKIAFARPPVLTKEMALRGLKWRKFYNPQTGETTFREVCNFCGGNCGQCGITERVGNFAEGVTDVIGAVHNEWGVR